MTQLLKKKELVNTKLANNYGGWIYCSSCNQTIGYLCYVTYGSVDFEYSCKCGNHGSLRLEMEEQGSSMRVDAKLITTKNRLCCPEDKSPLITILKQKLAKSSCKIVCRNCNQEYCEEGV